MPEISVCLYCLGERFLHGAPCPECDGVGSERDEGLRDRADRAWQEEKERQRGERS